MLKKEEEIKRLLTGPAAKKPFKKNNTKTAPKVQVVEKVVYKNGKNKK